MRFFVWLVVFSILLQPLTLFATPTSDLNVLLSGMHTLQANFVQTTYDNQNKAIQKSYGQVWLQRPGYLKWQVTKPLPQVIIASPKRLLVYDPDLEQVTIRSLKVAAGDTPAILLSHTGSLEQHYNVQLMPSREEGLKWYILMPKNKEPLFISIQLGFINQQIKEIRLRDHLDHTLKIQFEKIAMNAPLSSQVFEFKKPKGVDVIEER